MEDNLGKTIEFVTKAKAASEVGDYKVASSIYTSAVDECEKALKGIASAQISTLITNDDFENAKIAAEKITTLLPSFALGWFWKGMAHHKLDNQKLAKICFEKASHYEKDLNNKTSYMDWATRCQIEQNLEQTITQKNHSQKASSSTSRPVSSSQTSTLQNDTSVVLSEQIDQEKRENIRMQWYQSTVFVNIDIYAKKVIKEESIIEFKEDSLKVHLKRQDGPDYIFEKTLFAPIKPNESRWNVNKFKCEIHLKKAIQNNKWLSLDKEAQVVSAEAEAGIYSLRRKNETAKREKIWDKFADKELKDVKEDDSSMSLFRQLYENADDDVRRAMMKSYTESGGQVLSTDWDKVKKEKVTYKENE